MSTNVMFGIPELVLEFTRHMENAELKSFSCLGTLHREYAQCQLFRAVKIHARDHDDQLGPFLECVDRKSVV